MADLREAIETTQTDFQKAMNDDFNVREAMAALIELARAVNTHVNDAASTIHRGPGRRHR
ncbi:hypothetical protein C8039_00650 [Halogeometricum sp. wsp3]|nr:hypothetical protein C8039_00650 [Halogeometricum sp. wsp3]